MNQYKKNEIALYITGITFIIGVGLLTGDYLNYVKMLGAFFGCIGLVYLFYKSIIGILNKVYPEKPQTTSTLGAVRTYTTNFNYNERQD